MQPVIDTTKPHSARMYDYFLDGKDHFAADRETAQKATRSWPPVRTAVRENRAFLGRAVRYLADEAGTRQIGRKAHRLPAQAPAGTPRPD